MSTIFSLCGRKFAVAAPVTRLQLLLWRSSQNTASPATPATFSSGPITVLWLSTLPLKSTAAVWFDQERQRLLEYDDDVFCRSFLDYPIVCGRFKDIEGLHLSESFDEGVSSVALGSTLSSEPLPSGPYFLDGLLVHRVARLYDDPLSAFTCGLQSADERQTRFIELSSCTIPVPSRLYCLPPMQRNR